MQWAWNVLAEEACPSGVEPVHQLDGAGAGTAVLRSDVWSKGWGLRYTLTVKAPG